MAGIDGAVFTEALNVRERLARLEMATGVLNGQSQQHEQKLGVIDQIETGKRNATEVEARNKQLAEKDAEIARLNARLEKVVPRLDPKVADAIMAEIEAAEKAS